ncbi:DUF1697 domain-containing protein [Nakamurella silvestris]|nr:DUF1697 domain-containing protein [Nakamurella silvestris]
MTGYVLLLHGVNVGGNRKVPMADLRQVLGDLGFRDVATHLNSGNAVFGTDRTDVRALVSQIHAALERQLGLDIQLQLRTAAQLEQVIAENPLPEATAEPARFVVVFLDHELPSNALDSFDATRFPDEVVAGGGGHLYLWYRNGIGTSKLTLASLGKEIKTAGTARNWNSVEKLRAMAAERES